LSIGYTYWKNKAMTRIEQMEVNYYRVKYLQNQKNLTGIEKIEKLIAAVLTEVASESTED
jgi:predicted negative regulator of RcsB-dependent stress response